MQHSYFNNNSCVARLNGFFSCNKTVKDTENPITQNHFKKNYLKFIFLLFIGLLPAVSNATHIVGGALTYVYNGGTSYTVSLVLYRDCAGNAYPATATVQIRQADGTAYTTLVLNPGTATNIPYTLDSCAQAPSPIPCVQKRTYTASINLPPSTDGYHLYYSLCCRNSTLSNTTTSDQTTGQDGELFYAFIPGNGIWLENFTLANTTTSDAGSTAWTSASGTTAPTYAYVNGNLFEVSGANNAQATWTSEFIDISSYTSGVNLSADLSETTTLEANDSILVYYRLVNGGPLTLFTTNGAIANDFGTASSTVSGLISDSVQIVIRVHYDANSAGEIYRFDNVYVYNSISNNNPTYTQFPPLFLCAGNPFTFDHSATDADGDSLYYSFYTPYADVAPTYSGNVASFTPLIWNAGYSASSPLNSGGPALTLNSSTGLLSGTPNTIGQFQVGIKTTEYRNGVKLSDMVRDFQFNIINCPPPAQAYISGAGITNGTLSVCGGSSLTFPNYSDATATNWTWDFGDLTTILDVSTLQYPSYTYPGPGTYTARLIINAGTSCADTATAVVTVATPPAAPTASGTSICQGATATLTATAPGGTYQWYDAASGGNLLATNASYTTPTLTVTTTYYVQTTVSGCTGPRTAVTVTVTPTPAAPTAAGTTICQGTTATLTATAPGGTYAWYDAASGGTLLITNASYTTPTLTVTTTYYVQTTVSGCTGPRTAVTVTVTPTPAAPTAAGATICQGTTATLTATAPGGTYAWYDAASGGTLLITNASYTTPTLTLTTTYYVQTTVTGCAGPRTAVTVTVTPTPAAPTASGTTICTGTTATLTATAPGGTYQWYDAASGGTLLITNASYTTPALSANTTYYVQTTVAGCAGPRTAVTVTVSPAPAAPTASGTTVCQGTTATLNATAPGGTYEWYDAASGGTLLITNASYTTPALSANTTYYVQTTVAGCTGPRTAVTVTVTPTPAAPTASGTTICTNTTATLTATAPGGTYQWYDAASGGTLLITNASYTTPTLTVTTTYYVQTSVTGCAGPRTAVTVTVSPVPAAPTASGTTICQGTTATLNATAPGGTYDWYTAASGGTLLATNPSYTTPTLTVTTTYYVQTTVAGCAGPRTAVTVTITPTPAAPTAPGKTICTGTSAALTATAPGGTYEWYDAASGGTLLASNANYTTPTLTVTTTYYVQTTVAGCTGPRTAVIVTVSPIPAAPTAAGAGICTGTSATLTATAPGGTYQWYDAASGGTLLITNASYTTPALNANTTYYVQTTVAGCPGPRTAVTVTVSPVPAAPTAAGTTICEGTTATLTATAPGGTYDWYTAASGGTLLATNSSYTSPALTITTTYYVQVTVAGCTNTNRTAVTVTVSPTPATPTASGTTICNGSTATLTATAPGGSYEWYDAASGGTLLASTAGYTTPALSATTTYYVQTTISGCTSLRKAVTVTVTPTDDPSFNYSSGTYCITGTNPTPAITGGFAGTFSSSPAGLVFVNPATGEINLSASTLNTYAVTYTTSGPCPSSSTVNITVTNNPDATFSYTGPYCEGSANALPTFIPGASAGVFSAGAGLTFASTSTGEIDLSTSTPGTYTVTNTIAAAGGCAAASHSATVTINPLATVNAGTSLSICAGSTATLGGSVGGAATSGTWSGGTGTFSLNTDLNAVYTPGAGETSVILTLTSNDPAGPCGSVSDTMIVTINPIPAAPTASGDTICEGTATTLTATAPGGTYKWYTASLGGTLLTTGANYTTPALTGTTTYYVQATVLGCSSATRTPVTVTVTPTPATPTALGTTICNGGTATLTATAPGGTYEWYDAATGGTLLITNASYTTPVLSATTTYYVQTTISGCIGLRKAVTVTVNPIPAAPTAADATICDGSTATLTATAPGGTYEWYDAASGGTLLATNASYTTPALSILTTYYVQTTVGGCTGSRTAVTVTVNPIPSAPTASGTTICQGTTATLTATAPGGTYRWYTAPTGGTLLATAANYTTPVLTVNTTYYVQTTVLGCNSPRTAVTVTVTPTDDPSFNYSSGTYCISGSDPTPAITGGFPGVFSSSPAGLSLNTSNGTIDVSASTAGNYSVIYTTTGPCPASDTASITIINALDATFAYSGPYCSGASNPTPVLGAGASAGTFSATAGLVFVSTSTGTINLASSTPGTYIITNTLAAAGGCAGTSYATSVTIDPAPTVNANVDQTICAGTTATLAGSIGGSATSATWTGGTGTFSLNTDLNAVYTPGPNETSATLTLTTNDPAGPCGSVSDVIVITIKKDTASFNYSSGTYCITGTDPTPLVNGGYSGTFSSSPAGLVFLNTSTGEIDLSASTLNTYTVSFATNGTCPDTSTITVTVTNSPDATFSYGGPYCQAQANPSPTFGGGASAGVFSATPAGLSFVSTSSGEIDLTTTAPGTYTITNTIAASGGCAAASHTASVTVDPKAVVNAGSSLSICEGSTATLGGSVGGSATGGTWSGGTGSFSLNTDLNAVYTPGAGETSVILTLTSNDPAGPCGSVSDTMIITIHPIPPAPTASGTTICSGNTATLTATAPGGTYQWYDQASGGTLLASNSIYTSPVLTGNTTYYVQATVLGCTSNTRTAVTVTVTPSPTANAGSNTTVCSNNPNVTISGTVANAGGGKWTTSGSGTFSPNDSSLTATYVPSATDVNAGNVFLILTSTGNGICSAVVDSMLVTFSPKPLVNAGSDQSVCKSILTSSLNGSVTLGATTGKWTTSGSGTFSPNDTVLTATYTPGTADTTAGTVMLILTSTNNNGCNPVKDTLTLTYTNTPVVNAGSNQTVCANNATVSLGGSSSTGTGIWSTSGDGTFSPDNTTLNATYTPGVNDTTSGTVTITLTSTGGCAPVSKTMTVTITDAPVVAAGSNQFVCAGNLTVTLNGTVSGGSTTGKWTTTGTGTFVPNDSALNATYTMTAADTTAGSILLILTSSNNGNCSIVKDTLSVTYTSSPNANAGNDMIACTNNSVQLSGIISGGSGTGTWTTTNGSGTFVPNNTTLNASYLPADADTVAGNIVLVLTSTGGCVAVTDTVIITVNPGPVVFAGTDKTVCVNNSNISLSGSVIHAGGGKWTSSGSGTFMPSDSILSPTYVPSAADTTAGGVFLILTSKGNGSCTAVLDSMQVIFSPAPMVNAGADQSVCKSTLSTSLNGSVTLGATTGKWTTSGSGSFTPNDTVLNATYTPSTADTTAGSVLLVLTSINNAGCTAVTDTVKITYTNTPVVNAGTDQTVCANNATVLLNGSSSTGTGTWSTSGSGTFAPNNTALNASYIASAADTTAGTVTLMLTSSGGCTSVSKTITVTITDAPAVNAGSDQVICANNAGVMLSGFVTVASGGKWTTSGSGTFTPGDSVLSTSYVPSAADITSGVTLVLTSTGNAQCKAVTDTVKITFSPAPLVNANADIVICSGTMTASLNGTVTGGASTGKWSTSGSGTFTPNDSALNATYNLSTADTTAGSVTLILTSTNNGNCTAVTDTVVVTITSVPIMSAGVDTTVCSNNANIQLNGTVTGGAGTGIWTSKGSGTFSPSDTTSNATYTPSAADITSGSVTLIFTATNSCLATADTMILSISPAPTANAGNDVTICIGPSAAIVLNGVTTGASGAQWTTTGTGTFNPNNTTLNASYTPSVADMMAGTIKLVLTTTGNGNCVAASDTMLIITGPKPVASFNGTIGCLNAPITFNDSSTVPTGTIASWLWNFGNGTSTNQNPTNTFTTTGLHFVTLVVTTNAGCVDSVAGNIYVHELPTPAFTFTTYCPDSVQFVDGSSITTGSISTWSWSFGDSTISNLQNPTHTYTSAGAYVVTLGVTSSFGCVASVMDTVTTTDCVDDDVKDPKVPSAFTPNNDGHNDVLFVKGGPFTTLSFRVFNEWGNEIFSSADQGKGWDGTFKGKAQPAGSYVWTVIGTTVNGKEFKMVGGVTLIR